MLDYREEYGPVTGRKTDNLEWEEYGPVTGRKTDNLEWEEYGPVTGRKTDNLEWEEYGQVTTWIVEVSYGVKLKLRYFRLQV